MLPNRLFNCKFIFLMPVKSYSAPAILLLALLALFWGLNWPGMKIILNEVTVWWFRGACLIAGGCILLSVSALSGNRWQIRRSEMPSVMFCATFAILGWMVFSAYGVSKMPPGRASIVAFTMPLWATLISAWLLKERITPAKVAGLAIGLSGLGFLIGPDLLVLNQSLQGPVLMLLAAVSWATGTVLIKRGQWSLPPISNVAWQLLFSAVPVVVVAIISEPVPDLPSLTLPAWIALAYIFLFPMSFCQWAYFKVVVLLPASVAAIGTLMVPVVGVYSSHFILGEKVGFNELMALGLIVAALVMVLFVPNLDRRQ